MVKFLTDSLPVSTQTTVVDAFCGVGLFSAFLAPKVKRLVGIEISPNACDDFSTNLDDFEQVELYEAPVEETLLNVDFSADIIILDPPRAGLGAKTVAGVLAQRSAHLAYVSCDPATLARDGRQLNEGGYSLSRIALFDMFPQTYHIESISLWIKKHKIKRGWLQSHPHRITFYCRRLNGRKINLPAVTGDWNSAVPHGPVTLS